MPHPPRHRKTTGSPRGFLQPIPTAEQVSHPSLALNPSRAPTALSVKPNILTVLPQAPPNPARSPFQPHPSFCPLLQPLAAWLFLQVSWLMPTQGPSHLPFPQHGTPLPNLPGAAPSLILDVTSCQGALMTTPQGQSPASPEGQRTEGRAVPPPVHLQRCH